MVGLLVSKFWLFSVMLLWFGFCSVVIVCISDDLLVLLGLSSLNMLCGMLSVILCSVCMLLV